jgi:hypothetical protein
MRGYKILFGAFVGVFLVMGLTMYVAAEVSPDSLYAILQPGESITETKTVTIPELVPMGDVVFSFDLTGSMGGIIGTAKAKAEEILDTLDATPDTDINYGVMSYMDYPASYNSCGYSATYGSAASGDYAYSLDESVTDSNSSVISAINALSLGYGGDGPQDYTRIFYESYADTNVGWRDGARRILLNFGDNVPHDCDLNEGVSGGIWTTGGDPGRDEVMGNSDDLDLQTVLTQMSTEGVILLEAHTTTNANVNWTYWTGITGGSVFITTSDSLVDDVVAEVLNALEPAVVNGLELIYDCPSELTVTSVRDTSCVDPLTSGDTCDFEVTITVAADAEPGIYSCTISAVDDAGVNYGNQEVQIVVYDPSAGFVTGGGWIDSPEEAYRANPSLTGKANFGFVSKYKKNVEVPTGQAEFQFQVADLNFHSESYEWLIVNQNGENAQFKGVGTINGQNSPTTEPFKFMLWAGDKDPDTFRIKIWWETDAGTEYIVYDNGYITGMNQPISGGSIVIHTK